MPSPKTFPLFAALPPEIQLQIWDTAASTLELPAMHMLDIIAPFPTTTSVAVPLHHAAATETHPTRQRYNLPHRSHSSSRRRESPCRVQKRTPSPPANRRNGICFDTCSDSFTENNNSVIMSALDTSSLPSSGPRTHFDHSMYKFHQSLRSTCVDAANSVARHAATGDMTSVNLPSGKIISYNNAQDVLYLRFVVGQPLPATVSNSDDPPSLPSRSMRGNVLHKGIASSESASSTHPLSAIFQALWSPHLSQALHTARRIAIDVSQIWPTLDDTDSFNETDQHHPYQSRLLQDIVFLACTIQNNLEVLYLVDSFSPFRDNMSGLPVVSQDQEKMESRPLYHALHSSNIDWDNHPGDGAETQDERESKKRLDQKRQPDTIHGVGKVWREVFDLEVLGWHEKHPGFVFAETMSEVIRLQQGSWHGEGDKRPTFKGVRVLVAEDG